MAEPIFNLIFDPNKTYRGDELCLALTPILANQLVENNQIKIFINRVQLLQLLEPAECIGIRLYPFTSQKGGFGLLPLGVRSDRSSIRLFNTFSCIESDGSKTELSPNDAGDKVIDLVSELASMDPPSPFQRVAATVDIKETPYLFSVFFSETVIRQLLGNDESLVSGLRFYLDALQVDNMTFDTLTVISVGENGEDNTQSSPYLKSPAPCPPDCGGQGSYSPAKATPLTPPAAA